jgi:hypothetical protein
LRIRAPSRRAGGTDGRTRHILLAAGDRNIRVAGADGLVAEADAAHARAAELIESPGDHLPGDARAHCRLVRRVRSGAGIHDLAQNDFGHFVPLHAGVLKERSYHRLAQLIRRHSLEHAVDRADGGTLGGDNDYVVLRNFHLHIDTLRGLGLTEISISRCGVGKMRYTQDFLTRWLIPPARFERWVNVLADNDDAPAAPGPLLHPQELASVSLLSFY